MNRQVSVLRLGSRRPRRAGRYGCSHPRMQTAAAREWQAHLWELADTGERAAVRRARRQMALAAPRLAVMLRLRALSERVLGRAW